MNEELEDIIIKVVQDHLADWGTTAKIDEWDNQKNFPLRTAMNDLCGPLIDQLCKEIDEYFKKEKKNGCN